MKFEVGDRARVLSSSGHLHVVGELGTVVDIYSEEDGNNVVYVCIDTDDNTTWVFSSTSLERVEEEKGEV